MRTPPPGRYSAPSGSQACGVLGHGFDLAVVHVRGDTPHDAVAIVAALAFAESRELGGDIVSELSGEPGKLCRDAGSGWAMAGLARGGGVGRIRIAAALPS